jgi:catechol 2,3-dioxygenase-like lactoylglutathione lyase family enzyme
MRISSVTVWVEQPDVVRDWYVTKLGLTAVGDSDHFVILVADGDGDPSIAFHAGEPVGRPSAVQFHFALEDLDSCFQALTADGVVFDGVPELRPWGVRSVSCHDPAGHGVELVEVAPRGRSGSEV